MMRHSLAAFGLIAFLLTPAATFAAVTTYAGDGLVIKVLDYNEDTGTVRGELVRAGKTYPFTGTGVENGTATVVTGTFTAGGKAYEFTSRKEEASEAITFTTGGKTYKLLPQGDGAPPDKDADNPLAGDDKKTPVPVPVPTPAPITQRPGGGGTMAGLPAEMHLRRYPLPDVTLGVPDAYTALVPVDWRVEGQVEWQPNPGGIPHAQQKFKFTSPQDGRVTYQPAVYISYINAPSLGRREGEPVPDDFPAWLAENVAKYDKTVSNVRLIAKERNKRLEQQKVENDRMTGAVWGEGSRYEPWDLTLEYDQNGVRRRQESQITFVCFPPSNGLAGFFTQTWAMYFGPSISAPAETFAQQKPMLVFAAGSVLPTVRWFTLQQQINRENSLRWQKESWERIRQRGEQIKNMHVTPADQQTYDNAITGDRAQRDRLNTINETTDYKDVDGSTLNLSIHGKYKFSNGRDVVITNKYEKPGADFQEIGPAQRP